VGDGRKLQREAGLYLKDVEQLCLGRESKDGVVDEIGSPVVQLQMSE
jgi:hypothetical protein